MGSPRISFHLPPARQLPWPGRVNEKPRPSWGLVLGGTVWAGAAQGVSRRCTCQVEIFGWRLRGTKKPPGPGMSAGLGDQLKFACPGGGPGAVCRAEVAQDVADVFSLAALGRPQRRTVNVLANLPWGRAHGLGEAGCGNTGRMVDDAARDRAIYHALKAADEVAAALQAHLVEEHSADLDRAAAQSPSTDSLKLLRQARDRLGEGLRAVEADRIAESDQISLRNP